MSENGRHNFLERPGTSSNCFFFLSDKQSKTQRQSFNYNFKKKESRESSFSLEKRPEQSVITIVDDYIFLVD